MAPAKLAAARLAQGIEIPGCVREAQVASHQAFVPLEFSPRSEKQLVDPKVHFKLEQLRCCRFARISVERSSRIADHMISIEQPDAAV